MKTSLQPVATPGIDSGSVTCRKLRQGGLLIAAAGAIRPAELARLIALGDCLSIAPEIEKCDTFSSRADEDWEDIKPTYGDDLTEVADQHHHGDEKYRYFWDGQQWAQAEF